MPSAERNDYRAAQAVGIGLVAVVVLGSLSVYVALLTQQLPLQDIEPFSLPPVVPSTPLLPSLGALGDIDFGAWGNGLLDALVYSLLSGIYYLALGAFCVGWVLIAVGVTIAQDIGRVGRKLRRRLAARRVQALLALYVGGWVLLFNPVVLDVVVEALVVLTTAGVVFLFTAAAWVAIYDRTGPTVQLLAVYPLGTLAVLLPPVAAGLVSPSFRGVIQGFTTRLAVFLLDNVLVLVGLDTVLRRTFDLQGGGFFLLWVGLIVLVGWVVGLLARSFEGSLPRPRR
jgi:hypothetical protein